MKFIHMILSSSIFNNSSIRTWIWWFKWNKISIENQAHSAHTKAVKINIFHIPCNFSFFVVVVRFDETEKQMNNQILYGLKKKTNKSNSKWQFIPFIRNSNRMTKKRTKFVTFVYNVVNYLLTVYHWRCK